MAREPQQGLLETSSMQESGRLSHDFLSYEDFLSVLEMELSWDAGMQGLANSRACSLLLPAFIGSIRNQDIKHLHHLLIH